MMWPPHMPLARGPHLFHAIIGFPPNLMGGDAFSYRPMTPDGFPMPNSFGMAPRGFRPYGPRFSSDFAGPAFGLMFRGPPPGGFSMMRGPTRAPFMGRTGVGANAAARADIPFGGPPFYSRPPSQDSNRAKGDRKAPNSYRNDGADQVTAVVGQQQQIGKAEEQDHYSAGNSHKSHQSESEDEAPRRSKYGERKKKRRSKETDTNS